MLSEKDVSLLYETLLSSPGMNDVVKLDLKVPRKLILLLSQLIEKGISNTGRPGSGLIGSFSKEELQHLNELATECLEKSGLTALSEKLAFLKSDK